MTVKTPIWEMTSPVQCLCGKVYDLAAVTVTARYADCSMWKAPCCGRQADDRQWKSLLDYRRIDLSRVRFLDDSGEKFVITSVNEFGYFTRGDLGL